MRAPYGEELARCQRYFYRRSFAANDYLAGLQACSAGQVFGKCFDFPVPMRPAPSVTMTPAQERRRVRDGGVFEWQHRRRPTVGPRKW